MPYSAGAVTSFIGPLTAAMREFEINTPRRMAAFLAQVAHESGELRWLEERGTTNPWRGRGLLQITWLANYDACDKATGLGCVAKPDVLTTPTGASRSAGWFWSTHGLNTLADNDKFGQCTRVINGGYNGLDSRISYWLRARKVLGLC